MTERITLDGGNAFPVDVIFEPHGTALCGRGRGGLFLNETEGRHLLSVLDARYGEKPPPKKRKR